MKSAWFTNRARYDFGKLLQEADYSRRHDETLRAFLTMAACSLMQANSAAAVGACSVKIEAEYMREAKQFKKPEKIAEAFHVLVNSLEERPEDFLGKYVSELGMNDKDFRGQCFTPTAVCEAMARMVMHDFGPRDQNTKSLPIKLCEPACGCGAMIIASVQVLRELGYGPMDFVWHATDIDWRMATSTYIQLTLLDIAAIVTHGNTLSLESWRTFHTLRALQQMAIEAQQNALRSRFDRIRSILAPIAPATQPEPLQTQRGQLLLF